MNKVILAISLVSLALFVNGVLIGIFLWADKKYMDKLDREFDMELEEALRLIK